MKVGIIGLPQAGKSTIFRILTGLNSNSDGYQVKASLGVAQVPDPRLNVLTKMFDPKKTTAATLDLVDIGGISKGASSNAISAAFLNQLRPVDALLHVIRCFRSNTLEAPIPVREAVAAVSDELILSDLVVIEKRIERLQKSIPKTKKREEQSELEILERCRDALESETPLRAVQLTEAELAQIRGFGFISLKPQLIVLNADEEAMLRPDEVARLRNLTSLDAIVLSAALEEEIGALDASEMEPFLNEYGLTEPTIARVARACYALVGLVSFFTVGKDEVRAWTIPDGLAAAQAAGVIHSDLERGFIRAEVVPYDELVEADGLAEAKRVGKMRLEGKEYPVRDGDVLNIRFNV